MNSIGSFHLLLRILPIGCGVIGAFTDLRSRRIPNWLTGSAVLLGLVLHLVAGGWKEGASSLGGLLVCGAVFLVLYLAGGMGAGDVKMIAAEAALLGLPLSGSLLLYTVLAGGVMGLVLAIRRGQLRGTLANVVRLTAHHSRHGIQPHPELNVLNESTLRLPYAVAICCGCMLTVFLEPLKGWS